MAALADMLLKVAPREKQAWIHRSFALHELKRTQAAFDLLHPALEKFPRFWLVPYNLACYCAQLGQLPEARKWLARAIALGDQKAVTSLALEDKDLQPIHEDLKDR